MSKSALALALRQSPTPDDMYRQSFAYFRSVFRLLPGSNVRDISVLSHDLPEALRGNRAMMGATMSGAVAAILDHETRCGIVGAVPPEQEARLDEIIIEQGAIAGAALLTSDLVLSRVSEWERTDYRKCKRWLKSLDKAARIHQQRTAAPLDDPFLPLVKRAACEQIRLVATRMKQRLGSRRAPTEAQIVEAFAEELANPDVPFLNHEHNGGLWLEFYRRDPVTHLHLSAERLFDAFAAFVSTHDAEYVRKKISSIK